MWWLQLACGNLFPIHTYRPLWFSNCAHWIISTNAPLSMLSTCGRPRWPDLHNGLWNETRQQTTAAIGGLINWTLYGFRCRHSRFPMAADKTYRLAQIPHVHCSSTANRCAWWSATQVYSYAIRVDLEVEAATSSFPVATGIQIADKNVFPLKYFGSVGSVTEQPSNGCGKQRWTAMNMEPIAG